MTDFVTMVTSELLLPGIILVFVVSFSYAFAFRLGKSDSRGVGNGLFRLPALEFVDQVVGRYEVLGIVVIALGEGVLEILAELAVMTAITLVDKHSSKIQIGRNSLDSLLLWCGQIGVRNVGMASLSDDADDRLVV
jgi:hypothetical protein